MKQYVHPTIKHLSAISNEVGASITHTDKKGIKRRILLVEDLLSLGFIEKEEEPDTDDDWIDFAYIDFAEHMDRHIEQNFEEFKQAILSHLPKQWK